MDIKVSDIAKVCSGSVYHDSGNSRVTGVSIDSRQVKSGDLFVPIIGARVDGHKFLSDAIKRGARAALWQEEIPSDSPVPLIKVASTLKALQTLGSWYRRQFDFTVIAVTGSVGKTSTKDFIASVLDTKYEVKASKGNLNTEIGLPLTLFQLDRETEYAVLEMGMRGPGQIAHLAQMAQPLIGVVTNIGESHMEILGSKEAIAQAKGELIEALPSEGWAVLNGDDPYVVSQAKRARAKVLYYGLATSNQKYPVSAREVEQSRDGRVRFKLQIDQKELQVELPIPGKHNIYNALAAAAVAHCTGMTLEEIQSGLSQVKLTGMRCEVLQATTGLTIINDAYNACYQSMVAGLDLLISLSGSTGRKIAVLGDMLELGDLSPEIHRRVGEYVQQVGVDFLITVGEEADKIAEGAIRAGFEPNRVEHFPDTNSAVKGIDSLVSGADVVLVKGSRGMKLEQIVTALMKEK